MVLDQARSRLDYIFQSELNLENQSQLKEFGKNELDFLELKSNRCHYDSQAMSHSLLIMTHHFQTKLIKFIAPRMAGKVIDYSIQAHGGGGMCQGRLYQIMMTSSLNFSDFPMAGMMAWARVLRLSNGPDEIHVRAVSRLEMKKII